jgi:hypothetical protein
VFAKDCDLNDLEKPEHWKAWECVPEATSNIVAPKTKCQMICQSGYSAKGWPVDYHRSRRSGTWSHSRLTCQFDVDPDEIKLWMKKIEEEIANNRADIDDNEADIASNEYAIEQNMYNIEENGQNIQDGFRDIMNFNAIQLITSAHLEEWTSIPVGIQGALLVQLGGNVGYACNAHLTVDETVAHLLCQKAGYMKAISFETRGAPPNHDHKPLSLGDMACPAEAQDLSTCTSSGWGDLRDPACKDYNAVLWLTCEPMP